LIVSAQLATVNRTLRILEAFSYAEPVLGVSEIARKVGMGKSSVHRALTTLLDSGYVTKTTDDRYRLGWKLHELGQLVVSGLRLHEVAHEPLERLRRECDLAVNLVVLDGTDAVYIEQFESAGLARNFRESGRRAPAHTTSSGKCLLAFADPQVIDGLVAAGLRGAGPRAITSASALRAALSAIRDDGFVVSVEERTKSVTSIGAPVFGRSRQCIAAVSIVGPSLTLTGENVDRYVRQVRSCALRIGRAMGYSGPTRQ
jgi:IclR family transcriptional regulator, KDG regulon repressor